MNKDVKNLQDRIAQLEKDVAEVIIVQNALVDEVNKKKWLEQEENRITRNMVSKIGSIVQESLEINLKNIKILGTSTGKEKCPFQ